MGNRVGLVPEEVDCLVLLQEAEAVRLVPAFGEDVEATEEEGRRVGQRWAR